jgi:L-threonylcarbamoyladenylate synthase
METKILNCEKYLENSIALAVEYLKHGIPIAFPTETVYGVGSPIFNENGILEVFKIKDRPYSNPLAAHISCLDHVELLCKDIPDDFYKIAEKFLPGPISIVLKKKNTISNYVTGNIDTLSIRMPNNNICKALIDTLGQPIAATSANKTGKPSPNSVESVYDDLAGLIPVILDGGRTRYSIESTVLSLSENEPILFRPGVISQSDIEKVLGKRVYSKAQQIVVYNPETSKINNQPSIPMYLINNKSDMFQYLNGNVSRRIFCLTDIDLNINIQNVEFRLLKAETLFENLRYADKNKFDEIVILFDFENSKDEVFKHRLKNAKKI